MESPNFCRIECAGRAEIAFGSHRRRIADRRRYMRSIGLSFFVALPAIVLGCLGPATTSAQQSIASRGIRDTAPTGTYAAFQPVSDPFAPTNRIPVFTLHLETNGTYVAETADSWPVQDGDQVVFRPQIARGTWQWDAQKREFHLEPG